jgi:hypothetical protein
LIYEKEEAIDGHPCGVFSVTGDLQIESVVNAIGEQQEAKMAITGGKIWASLMYPLILREELQTVQTIETHEGGFTRQIHGPIRIVRARTWTPKE